MKYKGNISQFKPHIIYSVAISPQFRDISSSLEELLSPYSEQRDCWIRGDGFTFDRASDSRLSRASRDGTAQR